MEPSLSDMMTSSASQLPSTAATTHCRASETSPQPVQRHSQNTISSRTSSRSTQSENTVRKSRTPRDVAKKLFEQAISSSARSNRRSVCLPVEHTMPPPGTHRVIGGGISGIPSHHFAAPRRCSPSPAPPPPRPTTRRRSSTVDSPQVSSAPSILPQNILPLPYEKPQASTSGGAVSMTIQLAEPILFLQGLDGGEFSRTPAMLRGSMVLKITKPSKIKAVTLTFRGRARTEWPEGIPPKKSEYFEEKEIMQHTWPFFNAQFVTAELGHCADSFTPRKSTSTGSEGGTIIGSAISHLSRGNSITASDKMGFRISQTRSFSRGESPTTSISVAQRGYRVFQPGDYVYNFEMPLDSCLPETIDVDLGSVKYELEGCIERPGAFRPNLTGKKEVMLVRVPSEANLEQTEPIAISRTWEDQLHYDIIISGKAFPLGSSIPIAFKLTPLAKVRCHRIKIFITENIEYSCKNKKVHRLDPTKKIQLFEKRAESPATSTFAGSSVRVISGGGVSSRELDANSEDIINGTDNLLGDLSGAPNAGPTEMEFNVQLPGCGAKERERIHFDTTYGNIQVHHWIKIVMRLSKQDPQDSSKRRHFEISIDSPFHILSCRATNANTTLPAYDEPLPGGLTVPGSCTCPQVPRRGDSPRGSTLPLRTPNASTTSIPGMNIPPNVIQRPMHLLRHPSTNPPPFDADIPPPLVTPPPQYDSVVDSSEGLAGYFSRLAAHDDEDTDDDSIRGRRLPPLTPGGRVARSMDERRTWEPVGQV